MSTHDGKRMLAGARIDRRSNRLLGLYAGLGAALCVVFMASLCIGPVWIDPSAVLSLLHSDGADPLAIIAREIRLPRALLAILVGGSLGLGGAALQGLLRNPLAEPGIIGVSGCAALGAVLAFYTGLAAVADWMLPACAMLGAFVSVFALYALAGRSTAVLTLILAGIAINALAGALTTLILNLAPNPFAAYEVFFWLMGSLSNCSLDQVLIVGPFVVVGWAMLLTTGSALAALSLGEDAAASLGIDLARARFQIIAGTALAVGSCVAVSGIVGFVGLIVPHLLRPLVGHRPAALLGLSTLGGAILTLTADIGTRVPIDGGELKLGVATALVGAPFFLFLVLHMRVHSR